MTGSGFRPEEQHMSEFAELIIQISIPLVLILLGLFVGSTTESLHFKSLARREQESRDLLATELRSYPRAVTSPSREARMIVCEVVIATDYLKSFLAALKKLIGGEVKSYLSLVERARRGHSPGPGGGQAAGLQCGL